MTPGTAADALLIAHMRERPLRVSEFTSSNRALYEGSRMVQDAVIRNLQTLTGSSLRLSAAIKATEP